MIQSLRLAPAVALIAGVACAGQALAWGSSGHRFVTQAGVEALPETLPAFMRTPGFAADAAEIARDPDRSRLGGKLHDNMRDPAHFVDGDEDGKVQGGPSLEALPPTREAYDDQLRMVGSNSWKAGFLPYAMIDGWQQLVKDLALWRADAAGVRLAKDPAHKTWLDGDRRRRETLILIDLGIWSHFMGDASYPLHVTSHYDGWGKGPNPNGFTMARIHVPLEGPYVRQTVTLAKVKAAMAPYDDCRCAVETRVGQYLMGGVKLVNPFYQLEKDGGFKGGDPRGPAFMTARIAAGANQVRDMVVEAWNASGSMIVGYPKPISAADVEAGKAGDPYDLLHSND